MFGIGAGKISKLTIKKDGKTVANYDRGWDIKPQDKSVSEVYKKVLEEVEGNGSGKMTAGTGTSKTQAMKNLASAARPESKKVPVKYDSKGKAVITPEIKKAVNEEFERNKKKFPNLLEVVKQTLKKYFDKSQAYLDKDMYDEYAYENAKMRCLMKKIYGKEYATQDD